MSSIDRMLNPRSIAVVGATPRLQYGGRFLKGAMRAGDRVRVYPVNPKHEELMGVRCYPSLIELPEVPDLAGIIVPHGKVMGILEQCAGKGVSSAIVVSAGFAERGTEEGKELQRRIGDFARQSGVRVCGPNCLGMVNLVSGIWACSSSLGGEGKAGPIALVSQSGASAFGPFLSRAVDRGIGYSYIVSTGNEADLESSDFIRYLVDDPDTKVIACFIERFNDGRKFLDVARLAQERGKPIVMMKVGRSDAGSRAAMSHTSALTGADAVHDAAFRQAGVIMVEDYDEILEVSQLMAFSRSPEAEGIAVLSHSGGIGSLTGDKCGQLGLSLPELREETLEALNGILKGFGWVANPADVTGLANSDSFPSIMELMINEPEVGILAVASGMGEGQARQVIQLSQNTDRVVAFLWTGSQSATAGLDQFKESNIPVFYQPQGLARGLKDLLDYHHRREARLQDGKPIAGAISQQQKESVQLLSSLGRRTLTEHEAKGLLSLWGIPVTRERRASTWEEAATAAGEIGYPVVVKAESADILHKTEAGLVRLDVANEGGLRLSYDEIVKGVGSHFPKARPEAQPKAQMEAVLVQEMVESGVEVILGVSRDPQFGPVLMFGMGGIFVEVYRDVAMRVCPINRRDALEMLEEVKGARLLQGYRGRPPADVDALIEAMLKLSSMAMGLQDEIKELDINPLAVLPQGRGVKALDALVVLGLSPGHPG